MQLVLRRPRIGTTGFDSFEIIGRNDVPEKRDKRVAITSRIFNKNDKKFSSTIIVTQIFHTEYRVSIVQLNEYERMEK